jgi:ADP-ribose pyrophosphatase YjhB (NUDIX family)
MLDLYNKQTKCLVALDSIIFGFDGQNLKVLLVKRGIEENKETWSLMGGWLHEIEGLNEWRRVNFFTRRISPLH